MKRLLALIFVISSLNLAAQTNVGGVISGNVTWTPAGSPYTITANTLVQFSATLNIQPGVIVNVNSGFYLQIDGTLRAIGTASSPIIFQSSNWQNYWAGIRFTDMAMNYDSTTDTGNRISYAIISGFNGFTEAINIDSCWVRVHKSEISTGGWGIRCHNSSSFIDSNLIYNCAGGGINNWDDQPMVNLPRNLARGNIVHDCGYGIIFNRGIVEGNTIYNVTDGIYITTDWNLGRPPICINNTIYYVTGTALYLDMFSEGGIYTGNVFRFNNEHLRISCDPKCIFTCNRLMECTGPYKVYGIPNTFSGGCPPPGSGSYYPIMLDSNSWDGMSQAALDAATYDFNDDFSVGLFMVYQPMLADSDACLGAIPNVPPPGPQSTNSANQIFGNIMVYPNPAEDNLVISANSLYAGEFKIELYSVDGKLVYSYSQDEILGSFSHTIDLLQFPAGSYVLKLNKDGEAITSNIVKL